MKKLISEFKINEISEYEFREVCGFTFVFKTEILEINDQIGSASITPKGIIYTENDKYYFAPLDDDVHVEGIVKSYVEL